MKLAYGFPLFLCVCTHVVCTTPLFFGSALLESESFGREPYDAAPIYSLRVRKLVSKNSFVYFMLAKFEVVSFYLNFFHYFSRILV